jgi:hypothetical protein
MQHALHVITEVEVDLSTCHLTDFCLDESKENELSAAGTNWSLQHVEGGFELTSLRLQWSICGAMCHAADPEGV